MDKVTTTPIDEVLPIAEYERLHLSDISNDIKNHIENFVESPHDADSLKRMIMISLRQWLNDFDGRPSTVPNIGINDDKMCAWRYRKISRQVNKMGGWANFEHYVNKSFVNEAGEFNKLATFVYALSKSDKLKKVFPAYANMAERLVEGLK